MLSSHPPDHPPAGIVVLSNITKLTLVMPDTIDPNRYIHGKEWDAKFLEAIVSERMKALITKHCPKMKIGGMKGNSS